MFWKFWCEKLNREYISCIPQNLFQNSQNSVTETLSQKSYYKNSKKNVPEDFQYK